MTPDRPFFLQQYVQDRGFTEAEEESLHPLDELVLEHSLAGLYLLRSDEFLYVNETFAEMFGYSVQQLVRDKSPLELVAPVDRDRVAANIRERITGESPEAHYQFQGITKQGDTFAVEARGYTLEFEGEPAVGGTLLEVTDRESAKEELRLFRELVNEASDALLSVSAGEGRILAVNRTARRMMGGEGELTGRTLLSLFPDLPAGQSWTQLTEDLRDRDGLLLRSRFESPNGDGFPAELNLRFVEEGIGAVAVTVRDISQRIIPDASQPLQEKLFKQVTENMNQDFWIVDPHYDRYVYMNPSCRETWGDYFEGRDDLVEAFLQAVHPADRDRIRRKLPEQPQGGYDETYRLVRPTDGELRWFRDRAFPVHDEEGNVIRVAGLGEDITARKEVEKKLERSQRQFRQLAENIEATMFLFDLEDEEVLYVNPYFETMFNQTPETVVEEPLAFVERVHPEDREWVIEHLEAFFENPEDAPRNYEYRILGEEGAVRWLWTRWVPVESRDGKLVRIAGYTTDITERKQVEKSLRESELRFREMAENIEQGFYLVDENYREALYVNSIQEKLWGLSGEDLSEQPDRWIERVHPEDRDRVEGTLCEKMNRDLHQPFSFEYRMIHPDGDVRWLRTVNSPIMREGSDLDRIVSVTEDITREKRISQNLEQSLEETQTLLREVHHRVKNNLQVIVSLLGLQKRQLDDGDMKQILERCQDRIFSMALIHRKIYDRDRFSELDFSEYVPDLLEDLVDAHASEQREIALEYDLESCPLEFDYMVPLGLALTEVVSNALEHAFEGREEGKIEVTGEVREGELKLSIRDDGVGWSPEGPLEESESLGLKLLHSLIQKQLRGTVRIEGDEGVTVRFTIPLDPPV